MVALMNTIVAEKIQDFFDMGIPSVFERDLDLGSLQPPARGNLATVVTGIRRCGKTYRLFQEMHRVVAAGYNQECILYFNFEDERLKPYTPQLLSKVLDTFYAMRPAAKKNGAFLFFDEIQEVPEWGMFLRRVIDTQNVTLYVTGSSSKMLSTGLASEFRGRSLSRELFPMSFSEFVRFNGVEVPAAREKTGQRVYGSTLAAQLKNLLPQYLERGGFISVQMLSSVDRVSLLQEYAYRTVNMDVVERYGVRNQLVATQFLTRCLASSGRELSVNKLVAQFKSAGVSTSRATLASLLSYYQEAYLVFELNEFSRALAQNPRSASKVYAIDPGMLMAFSPSASRDQAQRLETAVFAKLRRVNASPRQGVLSRLLLTEQANARHEVDFVLGDPLMGEAYQLVQVTWDMTDEKTRHREIAGIEAGMKALNMNEGWIVTMNEEAEEPTESGVVHIVPAWKWLLD